MNHTAELVLPTELRCICQSGSSFFNDSVFFTPAQSASQGPVQAALEDGLLLWLHTCNTNSGHNCNTNSGCGHGAPSCTICLSLMDAKALEV